MSKRVYSPLPILLATLNGIKIYASEVDTTPQSKARNIGFGQRIELLVHRSLPTPTTFTFTFTPTSLLPSIHPKTRRVGLTVHHHPPGHESIRKVPQRARAIGTGAASASTPTPPPPPRCPARNAPATSPRYPSPPAAPSPDITRRHPPSSSSPNGTRSSSGSAPSNATGRTTPPPSPSSGGTAVG